MVIFFIFVEVYVGMCKCISRKLYIDLRDEIAVVLGYVKGALARLVFHFCYLFSYSFSYWYVVYSYFFWWVEIVYIWVLWPSLCVRFFFFFFFFFRVCDAVLFCNYK